MVRYHRFLNEVATGKIIEIRARVYSLIHGVDKICRCLYTALGQTNLQIREKLRIGHKCGKEKKATLDPGGACLVREGVLGASLEAAAK